MAIDVLSTSLGIVIIGRNEGERLVRCLESVSDFGGLVVYVDSGSTDGSEDAARRAGAYVVHLDMRKPFTAARARNAGMAALGLLPAGAERDDEDADKMKDRVPPEYIQFVDADCEVRPGWLAAGVAFLQESEMVGVVMGRLRERFPEASIYNALCDAEWDGPLGENSWCGGIAMMRTAALAQTTLFDDRMIAGEEPDLCMRLRRNGWKIWRIDTDMALHDAAMNRFGQFWSRMRRGGFAFGLWAERYRNLPYDDPARMLGWPQMRRAFFWGALLPALALFGLLLIGLPALLLLLAYPAQIARLASNSGGVRNAALLTLGKLPEAQGVIEHYWRRLRGSPASLIEHK